VRFGQCQVALSDFQLRGEFIMRRQLPSLLKGMSELVSFYVVQYMSQRITHHSIDHGEQTLHGVAPFVGCDVRLSIVTMTRALAMTRRWR
jgi:hypothetical protein